MAKHPAREDTDLAAVSIVQRYGSRIVLNAPIPRGADKRSSTRSPFAPPPFRGGGSRKRPLLIPETSNVEGSPGRLPIGVIGMDLHLVWIFC
jgi:hypothetical protein